MYSDDYNNEDTEETEGIKNESTLSNFYNNNKKLVWVLGIVIILILLLSILTKGSGKKNQGEITYDITFDTEGEIVLSVGLSTNLKATVENDSKATIKWSIDDSNVASIDGGNTVNIKGESIGKTKLTATYIVNKTNEPITKTKEVTVIEGDASIKLESVEFKKGDLYMPVGAKYKIKPVIKPTKARIDSKEYTSSDENVVVVDNNGEVTAVGEGTATITLNVNGEEFVRELTVYVDRNQTKTEIIVTPTKIKLDGELLSIKIGESHKLKYTVELEEADTEKLIWKSSDEDIVTVDVDGKIKGIKEGTATITVKAVNGEKDSIDIEVKEDIIEPTSIELSQGDMYLTVGQSQTITPIVNPDNASNKALSFMILDPRIAYSVPNENGTQATITGLSGGSTVLVIASATNSGVEKRVNVIVTDTSTPVPTPTTPSGPTSPTSTPAPIVTPVVEYTVRFNTNGAGSINPITVVSGETIGYNMPSNPTKANYIFDGWYKESSFINKFNSSTRVSSNMTIYAKWIPSIKQATASDIIVDVGDTKKIVVSHPSNMESYTFSSNSTSIATVTSNGGQVKGVGEGTTTINITGSKSGDSITVNVKVNTPLVNLTVTPNGPDNCNYIGLLSGHSGSCTTNKLSEKIPSTQGTTHYYIANTVKVVDRSGTDVTNAYNIKKEKKYIKDNTGVCEKNKISFTTKSQNSTSGEMGNQYSFSPDNVNAVVYCFGDCRIDDFIKYGATYKYNGYNNLLSSEGTISGTWYFTNRNDFSSSTVLYKSGRSYPKVMLFFANASLSSTNPISCSSIAESTSYLSFNVSGY